MEWFRWYHGAVSDPKWPIIARKAGVNVGVVVSVWAALLEHASQDEERGSITDFDGETFDALYGYDDGTCAAVVEAMREKGLICDGCICAWRKRQPLREDVTATERKRQQRSREKDDMSRNVTHESHNVTTEQNREEKIREELNTPPSPPQAGGGGAGDDSPPISDPADVDMGFHEFMAEYPAEHRAPEAEAAAVWKKLAREKKLPGLPRLFQGLDEWEASAQWKKQGGEFIPKAANFLRNLMWQDTPPVGLRSASKARAPTPYQQNMADKDALAQALLAERYGEKSNENTDFTQVIDIEHRVRKPSRASAVGPVG